MCLFTSMVGAQEKKMMSIPAQHSERVSLERVFLCLPRNTPLLRVICDSFFLRPLFITSTPSCTVRIIYKMNKLFKSYTAHFASSYCAALPAFLQIVSISQPLSHFHLFTLWSTVLIKLKTIATLSIREPGCIVLIWSQFSFSGLPFEHLALKSPHNGGATHQPVLPPVQISKTCNSQ